MGDDDEDMRQDDLAQAKLAASVAAFALAVPREKVTAKTRGNANTALARHVAMYLCHVAFELSLARVAAAFGRDRSTVAHACHIVEDRREDIRFDRWIATLEATVRRTPKPSKKNSVARVRA